MCISKMPRTSRRKHLRKNSRKNSRKNLRKNSRKHSRNLSGRLPRRNSLFRATPAEAEFNKNPLDYDHFRSFLNPVKLEKYDPSKTLLLIIDMQYDFIDTTHYDMDGNSYGNNFGVSTSKNIIPLIVDFIKAYKDRKGSIALTRDYHPCNHASFSPPVFEQGQDITITSGEMVKLCQPCDGDECPSGPFPPHCLHKSRGAMIHSDVQDACAGYAHTHVFFRGFTKDIDSFGASVYPDVHLNDFRTSLSEKQRITGKAGCLEHTGSYKIPHFDLFAKDPGDHKKLVNCGKVENSLELTDFIKQKNFEKVIICGLALDFCVFDTARNLCHWLPNVNIDIHTGLCRPAHVPILGGYLTDPRDMVREVDRLNEKSTKESKRGRLRFVHSDLAPPTNNVHGEPGTWNHFKKLRGTETFSFS